MARLVWKESRLNRASSFILQQYRHFLFYTWKNDWYVHVTRMIRVAVLSGRLRHENLQSLYAVSATKCV